MIFPSNIALSGAIHPKDSQFVAAVCDRRYKIKKYDDQALAVAASGAS